MRHSNRAHVTAPHQSESARRSQIHICLLSNLFGVCVVFQEQGQMARTMKMRKNKYRPFRWRGEKMGSVQIIEQIIILSLHSIQNKNEILELANHSTCKM